MIFRKLLLLLSLVLSLAAYADDLRTAVSAYESGDYQTAYEQFTRLALKNDAEAQYNLAFMHYGGDGIPQDDVKAAYWFEQAAKSGHASALEKDTFIYKTNIYNDNKTRVASYALTIFTPAVYYLGFTAYQNHKQQSVH